MVKKNPLLDRPRYSVFVRFRRTRLTLRRGIESLEMAIAFAEEARRLRFHQQDDVLILREPDGVIIDGGALGSSAGAPPADGEATYGDEHDGDAGSRSALSLGARPEALSPESVESAAEAHHRRLWRIETLRREAEQACARFEPVLAEALVRGALTEEVRDELGKLHRTLQALGVELRVAAREERKVDANDQAPASYELRASTDRRDDSS